VFVCTCENDQILLEGIGMVLIFYNFVWAIFSKPGLTQVEHGLREQAIIDYGILFVRVMFYVIEMK
jgi:hypothetical protein